MDAAGLGKSADQFIALRRTAKPSARVADDLRPNSVSEGYDLQQALSQRLQTHKGDLCVP